MTGPYHYRRAAEIHAEIQATNAVSNEAGTAWRSRPRRMPFSR
jgi:hypothetical protein